MRLYFGLHIAKMPASTMHQATTPSASKARLAILVLSICCIFWGFSFPAMQIGAAALERAIPGAGVRNPVAVKIAIPAIFNAWRFGLAGILYYVFTRSRNRPVGRSGHRGGVVAGLFCGVGMLLQIVGLQYTLPSTSAFLTALSVLFAPLAQAILFRRAVGLRTWLAVLAATSGMLILSQSNPDASASNTLAASPPLPHLGQILTILSALLFTGQILAVDHYGKTMDPVRLSCLVMLLIAATNFAVGLAFCHGQIDISRAAVTAIRDPGFYWPMLGLVLFSSIAAIHFMTRWQPLISPATAAVVYCLEPIFSTAWSLLFHTEKLSPLTLQGGVIILVAVVMVMKRPETAPGKALSNG